MLCASQGRKRRKLEKEGRAQERWGGCQELQRFGKMQRLLVVQIYHPMSHGLKYLQANRKAIGRSLTKKGMVKKCSDHSDLFGEFQGKK